MSHFTFTSQLHRHSACNKQPQNKKDESQYQDISGAQRSMGNSQSQQQDRQQQLISSKQPDAVTAQTGVHQVNDDWSTPPSSPPASRPNIHSSQSSASNHHHQSRSYTNNGPQNDYHRTLSAEAMANETPSFSLLRAPSAKSLKPRGTIPVTITYLSRDAQHVDPPKPIVIKQPQPIVREPYTQPGTERSFKNSSRIVHAFGVGGLAPLAPLARGAAGTQPLDGHTGMGLPQTCHQN